MHYQEVLIHHRYQAMTKAHALLRELKAMLQANADPERRIGQERYFKGTIRSHGIPMPVVLKIGRTFLQKMKPVSKETIFQLCEELWKSGNFEESIIACHWSRYPHQYYAAGDMKVFERWVSKYVGNWASCDTFCNHSVAMLLEKFPGRITVLRKWTRSRNRWMRRAAAVSLIIPAKKGLFTEDILDIAARLLEDKDDMVQKGYGWMLKEAAAKHPQALYDFVMSNRDRMPRTALRYAIEKWPPALRAKAMH